ncbi:MAG TPA: DUF2332 domain-containing protein [Acidimicrobiia bacterium]|nr:DUF2332 domain-containing protein [Acidimicrobiia bacterium]
MSAVDDLAAVWLYVADTSCRGYSPLYDRICRAVAGNDDVLELVSTAPPVGHNPLLLLAAVHYLVLGGLDHPLASVYAGTSDEDPGPLFIDVCLDHRDELLSLLATEQVNTNEVGRAAVLGPAFTEVAARFGAPLSHLDVGCSAGLNLLLDRYRLDYGAAGVTGPADAAVEVRCDVVGGSPPIAPTLPAIAGRIGLDRAPVDPHDPHQSRWQLACVWPDTGRLERTARALEEARRGRYPLVHGDAVERVGDLVADLPRDSLAVVTTTWVVGYFPGEQRAAFRDALAAASNARPIVWISAEGAGVVELIPDVRPVSDERGVEWSVLGLATFRDGIASAELLGYAHPHGSGLDWRASAHHERAGGAA